MPSSRMPARALAVVAALAVPLSGLPGVAADPGEPRVPDAAMSGKSSGPAPVQRSGSAGDRAPLVDGGANDARPPSLRSTFPMFEPGSSDPPVRQAVSAGRPVDPKPVNGFNAATSRELPERRDKFAQSFRNADGTQTTVFSVNPVNYQRPDGSWSPIATTLVRDGSDWVATTVPAPVRVAGRIGRDRLSSVVLDQDHEVAWGLAGARAVDAVVAGGKASYAGVAENTDLELEVRTAGVKETIVLRSKAAPRSFVFPLRLTGLTAELVAGEIVLRDQHGKQRAVIPAGSMEDSAKASSNGVSYRLVTAGGGPALRVDVDPAWLDDPARVFPVRVDPTVLPTDGWDSNYAVTVRPGGAELGDQKLELGWRNGGGSAAYLSFGHVSSGPGNIAYHRITGAELAVLSYDAGSCSARWMRVHGVKQQWQTTPRDQLRFPGPPVTAELTGLGFANGYIKTGQTTSACGARWQRLNMWTAGRNLIQDWVNQKGNYGLALRAGDETDPLAWKKFTGTATANPPKLFVTHTPYNAYYNVHPLTDPANDAVMQDRAGKIPVTVKNTSAQNWTPASHYVTYRVFDAAGRRVAAGTEWGTALPGDIVRTAYRTFKVNVQPLPGSADGTPYRIEFTVVHRAPGGNVAFTDQLVPPGVANIEVFNIQPSFTKVWPVNGYQSTTLTPNLWAAATDADAPDTTITYWFNVCELGTNPAVCFNSGAYGSSRSWTIPAGKLSWNKRYQWRPYAKDNDGVVTPGPVLTLTTDVPQPPITSKIANSPLGSRDKEYDPQVGNYTTAALDASIPVAGPGLNVVRTYNSLDPRKDRAFGAGWSSLQDMRLIAESNGNAVVTYPDGQQVRFGKNPDGKYAAPPNRKATLIKETSGAWTLKAGTRYSFAADGKLQKVIGPNGLELVLAYRTDGTLQTATSSGRALTFTWTADKRHVASIAADTLTWSYTYAGDVLTKVCNPNNECTSYGSAQGSHYRTAVLDSRPDAYYRMNDEDDADRSNATNEIDLNFDLNRDTGVYGGSITRAVAGPLAGADDKAVFLNGHTGPAYVDQPRGQLRRSRDGSVEMWFRTNSTYPRPLMGYQAGALTSTGTIAGMPILYVGDDGKLRGNFWNGAYTPITSAQLVNDNQWHHVVLTVNGTVQTMHLDGMFVGSLTGVVNNEPFGYNQIGAAHANSPGSWPSWGADRIRYFAGQIDEVAIYSHPLTYGDIWSHWTHGRVAADQTTSVTSPGGRVKSQVAYDTAMDRVREYTDSHGGTWEIGSPESISTQKDLRRIVTVKDPADRPYVYEYDGFGGWLLRTGQPVATDLTPDDPVFNWTTGEGFAIRSYFHDTSGRLTKLTNELGAEVSMTYDARGNVASRKACRTGVSGACHTEYTSYHFDAAWPEGDPRLDKPFEVRDGRSASATDNTYRSVSSYTVGGDLSSQKQADGGQVSHSYTNGTEASPDGKTMPKGLLLKQTGQLGASTSYVYFSTGQLAEVSAPSGLRTRYTYDTVGRKLTETQVSDTYPVGVTTTYTYDNASRVKTVVGPETTDAVTGQKHRQKVELEYDADGHVTKTTTSDVVSGGEPRVTTVFYDDRGRPDRTVNAEGKETNVDHDQFGNVTRSQDANGNVHEYRYTALNMLTELRLADPAGTGASEEYKVLRSAGYDKAGRKVRETDAMGRTTAYDYYADDLLKTTVLQGFHNPDGSVRDFIVSSKEYDGAGNLTKEAADNGRTVTDYTRDVVGRLKTQTVLGGVSRQTTYDYDLVGNIVKKVASGAWSNVSPLPEPTPYTVDYVYDTAGRKTSESVANPPGPALMTSWTYDQRGLVLSSTSPRGNGAGAVKADFTTSYAYDELGRQVRTVAPKVAVEVNGSQPVESSPTAVTGYGAFGVVTSVKDARGNITNTSYDKMGRPIETIAPTYTPPGGTPTSPTTRLEYDGLGQVITSIDERGNVTRFTYDRRGRKVKVDAPASTNDERAVWTHGYTDNGALASTTDPLGAVQQWTYDDLDRKVTHTVVDRKPTTANFTSTWAYDDQGNVTSQSSPSGAVLAKAYDSLGQLIKVTDPNGVLTHIGYDSAGRQARVADGMGRTTRTAYDRAGRLVSTAEFDAAGTALGTRSLGHDLDGNVVSTSPPGGGRASTYSYDALGRMVQQVDPVSETASVTVGFGYDAAGHRTRYTDGRGNSTVYTANSLGLPESVIEPSTVAHPAVADRTWTASYDAAGNPVSFLSPGGVRRTRTFDAAGRLTREEGSGAESSTVTRELGYDLASRVVTHSSYDGMNTQTYNDRGLMLRSDGPSGTASFGYDSDGLLTQRIDAAGTADFTYVKGRLASVTDPVSRTLHTLGHNAAGQLASIDYGSGRVRSIGYDPFGRLASDVLKNSTGTVVSSASYGYDAEDQILTKKTAGVAGAGDHTYGYDELGRLTKWQVGTKIVEYGWDAASNRTSVKTAAGEQVARFDERNRLITDSVADYSYSPRGSLLSKTTGSTTEAFSFDAFDRLIKLSDRDYSYDALDRPVAITSSSTVRMRYAGFSDEVVTDGTQSFGRGPGDELMSLGYDTSKRLVLSDRHRDVIGGFDPADTALTGGLPDTRTFDPWGESTHSSGLKYRIGYQGDWTDPRGGHVNQGARWYDPGSGTFDSRDTVSYPAGTPSNFPNLYAYAAGNPINNFDPTGNGVPDEPDGDASCYTIGDGWICPGDEGWQPGGGSGERPGGSDNRPGGGNDDDNESNQGRWDDGGPGDDNTGGECRRRDGCGDGPADPPCRNCGGDPPIPPCGLECQQKKTDKAKDKIEKDLRTKQVPLPDGIDDPKCPRGNPMCNGSPNRPSELTGDNQTVTDQGTADRLNQQAVAVKRGVVGAASRSSLLDRLARYGLPGANLHYGTLEDLRRTIKENWRELGHHYLDLLGLIPGFGEPADLINAIWYAAEGDKKNAALSGVSMVPVLGWGSSGARIGRRGKTVYDGMKTAGGCKCFPAGTKVATAGGSKPIEDVKVGDRVWARDMVTGKPVLRRVTGLFRKHTDELMTMRVAGETVAVTSEHPFYTPDRGWVQSNKLKEGDKLLRRDGTTVTVERITHHKTRTTVYNFAVEGNHNYFIGLSGLLVHNCLAKPLGRGSTGRSQPQSLKEQLAMKEVMSDPAAGRVVSNVQMTDPRWPGTDGWVKMHRSVNGIVVHYVRNVRTGEVDDFKFK